MSEKRESKHSQIKRRIEGAIKKAEEGDIYYMKILATAYAQGEYLPKDYIAAQAWLRKAVEFGNDEAKKRLAKLLSEGNGIAQNLEEAFDINQELMFDCDLDAMTEVGLAYKFGKGVPKDEEKASYYLRHSFDIEMDLMEFEKRKKLN